MNRRAWIVVSALTVSGWLSAQSPFTLADVPVDKDATQRANSFRRVMFDKRQVYKNVRRLTKELTWHKKLEDALGAAETSGKPVLLVQALGDLRGYV